MSRSACFAVLAAFLFTSTLAAQISTGSLSGAVSDPNGAVVPGAKITIKHDQTAQEFATVSSEAGVYAFPNLPVGPYTLTAEHPGFKKLSRSGLVISIATRAGLDLRLELGEVTQSVEISAETPLLATATSELGSGFVPKLMRDAPLFVGGGMRSPEAFVAYMPGVNNGAGDSSINGGARRAKEVLLDGASQTIAESGGVVFDFPAVEQFGEFRLLTNNFSAEYGRTGGGIEIFVTRSGTNRFHGTAFDFLRNDKLDAAGWSVNAFPGRTKAKYRQNEFGVAAGGPIWIPKLYNGRNKSFWYFTYNGYRQNSGFGTAIATIATPAMRQGDFTQVLDSRGLAVPIYDPATTSGSGAQATRQPFAGNLIPQARFSAVSGKILPLLPTPSTGAQLNNYVGLNKTDSSREMWSLKGDHNISDRNRLSAFFNLQGRDIFAEGPLPGPLSANSAHDYQRPQNYRANHDFTIKPTLLHHFTFGFTRQQQLWDNPLQTGDWAQKIGLRGVREGTGNAFPVVTFGNSLTAFANTNGNKTVGSQFNWNINAIENITWIKGRHQFKFGFDFRRLRTFSDPRDLAGVQGVFAFNPFETASPAALSTSGHSWASFLLGAADSGNVRVPLPDNLPIGQGRFGYQAWFAQDDFKLSSRLTLNLGLRYDIFLPRFDPFNQLTSFDPNLTNPGAGGLKGALAYTGTGDGRIGRKRFSDIDYSSWGPRLGLAYQITPKTVLRAGFGIYYGAANNTQGGFCIPCSVGFESNATRNSDGLNPAFLWDAGFTPPAGFVPPPFINPSFANGQNMTYMVPESGKPSRVRNWSVNIQRELPGRFVIDVAYAGSYGDHSNLNVLVNQVDPKYLSVGALLRQSITTPEVVAAGYKKPYDSFTGTLAQALRPYPQYLNIRNDFGARGKFWYNSYQMKLERRYTDFNFLMAYTFSKTIANGNWSQTSESALSAQNSYAIEPAEKSLQRYDTPHILNFIYSWDIPLGRGKKFLNSSHPVVSRIVGGWTVSALHQYRSGGLLQIDVPNTLANTLFTLRKRPNVTGRPFRTGIDRTTLDPNNPSTRWLNRDAYDVPADFAFGNAANFYGEVRNPKILTENFSIIKRTAIRSFDQQPIELEYRMEMANPFNRTLFGGINGNLLDANFGRPTGVMYGPRAIQMVLKLNW